MEITKTFVVRAGPDAVWAFLTDPERVAACLPGAAITGRVDDQIYTGTIAIKVGPVSTSYRGKMRFERLDPAARTAEIVASGQDVRGKGGADMKMKSRLVEQSPGTTEVTVVSEVAVTGILAQMGRGMITDVSDQLFGKFTAAATAALESPAPNSSAEPSAPQASAPRAPAQIEPIPVVSLGAQAAGRALGRTARRPLAWALIVLVLLAMWWLWLR
jgi:carbon monoxide dehydrogenase subunit G